MELNEYQKQAMTTCMQSCENFSYMALNLMGEEGEFMGKVAKLIRQGKVYINNNVLHFTKDVPVEVIDALQDEGGDMFWQLMGLYTVMGWDAEEIAQRNLAKLRDRAMRNVIIGEGDNR